MCVCLSVRLCVFFCSVHVAFLKEAQQTEFFRYQAPDHQSIVKFFIQERNLKCDNVMTDNECLMNDSNK